MGVRVAEITLPEETVMLSKVQRERGEEDERERERERRSHWKERRRQE